MFNRKKRKTLMFNRKETLYAYCKEHELPYDTIAYRVRHNKDNLSLKELIELPNYSNKKETYPVIYDGQFFALNTAIKKFFKDNKILCSTNSGYFTKKLKEGANLQEIFDEYCKLKLKKLKL